jgi:hypothetical protein
MKLIGAGLMKTGTSSARYALKSIDWKVLGYMRGPTRLCAADIIDKVRRFDSVFDLPASSHWRELAEAFPAAGVLLTLREDEAWADSMNDWLQHQPLETVAERGMAVRLFGSSEFDATRWIAAKRRHEDAVRAWGAENPGRLLELDVIRGEGWGKLGPFLGVDRQGDFPHIRPGAPRASWRTCGVAPVGREGETWRK